MTATQMTAKALGFEKPEGAEAPCGLCGGLGPGRRWREVVKGTFTNIDEIRSDWICWGCEFCLNDRRTRSNVLVEGGVYRRPERKDLWLLLKNPPAPPFVLYMTVSGKKHGLFRQAVSLNRDYFRIQCEAAGDYFDRVRGLEWMRVCRSLILFGVRRESVLTGQYSAGDFRKAGVSTILESENCLQFWRPRTVFQIVFSVMPSTDDLKGDEYA